MSKNLIISFEGIEGSGKSLHLKKVAVFLKKNKIPFVKLREPGGSKKFRKNKKINIKIIDLLLIKKLIFFYI